MGPTEDSDTLRWRVQSRFASDANVTEPAFGGRSADRRPEAAQVPTVGLDFIEQVLEVGE